MTIFYDNLKATFANTDTSARGVQKGRVSTGHPKNDIVNYFQYAPATDDAADAEERASRLPTYYTPFSWSDGTNTIKGMVVSGNTHEGMRILGMELEDGRSFNSSGTQKFFNDMKEKGAFSFAQEAKLWENKERGDWPFQPGNPFDFYTRDNTSRQTVDEDGKGTFRVEAASWQKNANDSQNLRDALTFFRNLRKSRGQE